MEKYKKNWGNIEYKKHLGDMAYLVLFFLFTFDKMLGTTMIGSRYPEIIKMSLRGLLAFYLFYKLWNGPKSKKWELVLYLAIILVSAIAWRRTGNIELLEVAFLIIGARDVDFSKILRVYLIVTVPILVGTVVGSQLGIVENLIYHRGQTPRAAFGFIYPTDFVANIFYIVLVWCVLRNVALRYCELAFIVILAVFAYVFCEARMNVLCLTLAAVSFLVLKKWNSTGKFRKKAEIESGVSLLLIWGSAFFAFLMVFLSYFYRPDSVFWQKMNAFLTERLFYGHRGFEEFGVTLFGQKLPIHGMGGTTELIEDYFFLDSSYVKILLEYGIVLFVMVLVMFIFDAYKLRQRKQYYTLVALALLFVQCTMEHHMLEIAYNPFLFLVFSDYTSNYTLKLKKNE